jgi:hypothetical protein
MSLPAVCTQKKVLKLPAHKRGDFKFFKNNDLYEIGMMLGLKLETY